MNYHFFNDVVEDFILNGGEKSGVYLCFIYKSVIGIKIYAFKLLLPNCIKSTGLQMGEWCFNLKLSHTSIRLILTSKMAAPT